MRNEEEMMRKEFTNDDEDAFGDDDVFKTSGKNET